MPRGECSGPGTDGGHLAWGAGVGPGQGRGHLKVACPPQGAPLLPASASVWAAAASVLPAQRRVCSPCRSRPPARILVLRSAVLLAFTGVFIRDSHQIRFPSSTCRCFKCPHFTENGENRPKEGVFLRLKSRARSRGPRPLRLHTQLLEHHLVCPRCTPGPVGGGSGVHSVRAAPRGLL